MLGKGHGSGAQGGSGQKAEMLGARDVGEQSFARVHLGYGEDVSPTRGFEYPGSESPGRRVLKAGTLTGEVGEKEGLR